MARDETGRAAHRRRQAFTLIELLIVVAVIVVLAVMLIPQIRVISKDRTLRESARVVSSVFVDAVERARVEGAAGVALVRNPRFYRYVDNVGTAADPQGSRVYYACYALYQLKNLPPYVGNYISDRAVFFNPVVGATQFDVIVPAPYDTNVRIETGTYIQLGDSPNRYVIDAVTLLAVPPFPGLPENLVRVTFSVRPFQSGPPAAHGQPMTFKIHRRPRLMANTEVSLPRGYFINLNYSGELDLGGAGTDGNDFTWTAFTQSMPVLTVPQLPLPPAIVEVSREPIYILFDSDGSIDRVLPNGFLGAALYPTAAVNLCLAADDYRHSFPLTTAPPRFMPQSYYENPGAARDVLNDPALIWVSIDHRTGYVGVGDSAPPTAAPYMAAELSGNVQATQVGRILESWRISATRTQSAQ